MTDFGETAEPVLEEKLRGKSYDCVVIAAGIRIAPSNSLLFDKPVNLAHSSAPQAKLCFNTPATC